MVATSTNVYLLEQKHAYASHFHTVRQRCISATLRSSQHYLPGHSSHTYPSTSRPHFLLVCFPRSMEPGTFPQILAYISFTSSFLHNTHNVRWSFFLFIVLVPTLRRLYLTLHLMIVRRRPIKHRTKQASWPLSHHRRSETEEEFMRKLRSSAFQSLLSLPLSAKRSRMSLQ
jgi:hypothetical protein